MAYLLNTYRAAKYVVAVGQAGRTLREVRSGPASRHHRFFEADWSNGASWMLKQPVFSDDAARFGIANEGFAHGLLATCPAASLYIVPLVAYDSHHQILVTQRLPAHQPVARVLDALIAHSRLEPTAYDLGRALAVLHGCLDRAIGGAPLPFTMHAFKPNLLTDGSAFLNRVLRRGLLRPPVQRLLAALMRDPKVEATLRSLGEDWRFDAAIHGDATAHNVLVRLDDPDAPPRLCDWEFAGRGDSRWDAASFFQELLRAYGRMKVTVCMITRAAMAFHRGYFGTDEAPPFAAWFADLLRLSAAGSLELTLANGLEEVGTENARFLNEAAHIEFLVEHVLTGQTFLKCLP